MHDPSSRPGRGGMPQPMLGLRAAALASLALVGCSERSTQGSVEAPTDGGLMIDVARASGLDFTITSGATPPTQILEVKGGGLALFDWLGDGDWDVFFPNGATLDSIEHGPGARLYDSRPNLSFEDASLRARLDFHRWGMGTAAGDLDGDGRVDLFIAAFGRDAVLLQSAGGELGESIASLAGDDAGWSSGVALGDLDADGDLDVYVARYLVFDPDAPPEPMEFLGIEVFGGPMGLEAVPDHLWVNDGSGQFEERAAQSGLYDVDAAHGLGATILDVDGDGKLDIYVGNDSMPDALFLGLGGMQFENRAVDLRLDRSGDGRAQATMGIAVADINSDGRPDFLTTNFSHDGNLLRLSGESGRWSDRSTLSGIGAPSRPFCGWSAAFVDLDQDAREELLVFNGHVYPDSAARRVGSNRAQTPLYFEREGERFERVIDQPWLAAAHCDRGAAYGDLDGDGDTDAIVVELNGPVRVLQNQTDGGGFVTVLLGDTRDFGARITLSSETQKQTRWIASGLGYQSASAPEIGFGLGDDRGPFTLDVTWPDGQSTRLESIQRGDLVSVVR